MTNLRCRTILPAQSWILNNCLVLGRQNIEKRDKSIFMQSPGRWYLLLQGKLLHRATTRCYRARKKRAAHRQEAESIFKSGEWTYILCNQGSTNFVFHSITYWLEPLEAMWQGESKFFLYFLFSASVTKTSGWTTLLLSSKFSGVAALKPLKLRACTSLQVRVQVMAICCDNQLGERKTAGDSMGARPCCIVAGHSWTVELLLGSVGWKLCRSAWTKIWQAIQKQDTN